MQDKDIHTIIIEVISAVIGGLILYYIIKKFNSSAKEKETKKIKEEQAKEIEKIENSILDVYMYNASLISTFSSKEIAERIGIADVFKVLRVIENLIKNKKFLDYSEITTSNIAFCSKPEIRYVITKKGIEHFYRNK